MSSKGFEFINDGRLAEEQPGTPWASEGGLIDGGIRVAWSSIEAQHDSGDEVDPSQLIEPTDEERQEEARVFAAMDQAIAKVAEQRGVQLTGIKEHATLIQDEEVTQEMLTILASN